MKRFILICVFMSFFYAQDDFEAFKRKDQEKFKKEMIDKWLDFRKKNDENFKKFVDEMMKKFNTMQVSNSKKNVSYSPDMNVRQIVDFDKGELVLEFTGDTKLDQKTVQNVKEEIKKQETVLNPFSNEPVLMENINIEEVKVEKAKPIATNKEGKKVYQLKVKFKEDFQLHNEVQVAEYIQLKCDELRVPYDLVMAIIKVKSNFNVQAKVDELIYDKKTAYDEKYGVMQLVPNQSGRLANKILTKNDIAPDPKILMDPKQNILYGIAYIKYLKDELGAIQGNQLESSIIAAYDIGPESFLNMFNENKTKAITEIKNLETKKADDLISKKIEKVIAENPDKKLFVNAISDIKKVQKERDNYRVTDEEKEKYQEETKKLSNNTKLIDVVNNWLGTPYLFGGDSKNGVDCSAFVQNVYQQTYSIVLPRNSYDQFIMRNAKSIDDPTLKEGDLVFFKTVNNGKPISHVGVYINANKFAHASSSRGVVIDDIKKKYYSTRYKGAKRHNEVTK